MIKIQVQANVHIMFLLLPLMLKCFFDNECNSEVKQKVNKRMNKFLARRKFSKKMCFCKQGNKIKAVKKKNGIQKIKFTKACNDPRI